MALIARLFDFQPGATIISADLDAEFNQIINMLNGSLTTKNALFKFSGSDPVVAADQLSTGTIQEWRVSGSNKLRVNNNGSLESLIATGTAPFIAASTTLCPNLNADLLDGFTSADFAKLATHKTAWSFGWFYPTPPSATEGVQSVHDFSVPPGNTINVTKLRIIYSGGSHTSGAVLTFTVFRRSSTNGILANIGTITLDNTNSAAGNTYEADVNPDVTLNDGDRLSVILTTRTGTITETQITVVAIGTQMLTT